MALWQARLAAGLAELTAVLRGKSKDSLSEVTLSDMVSRKVLSNCICHLEDSEHKTTSF